MARYPFSSSRRRRNWRRNRTYIISGLLIIAVVVAFFYGWYPFGESETKAIETSPEPAAERNEATRFPPTLAVQTEEPRLDLTKLAPETTAVESNLEATELIAEAMALVNAEPSRVIDAREKLNAALQMPMNQQQRAFVKEQLSRLADRWLFSRTVFPTDMLCDSYRVRQGDKLSTIGEQFRVPHEILMQINHITRPEALRAASTIKVVKGPFHAKVYRSTFTMDMYLQNTFVRSFPVGLGRPGMETPTGRWVVKLGGKLISPSWTDPDTQRTYRAEDPDYPLGSRWIALEGRKGEAEGRTGFAIHGTKDPNQIGTAGSRGCIRLHNGNAILVYNLLMPGLSQVEIVE